MKSPKTVSRNQAAIELKRGKVGIIPTDTMYGLAGLARFPDTIERIYRIKNRTPDKPMVVLISEFSDLTHFDIALGKLDEERLSTLWPGPISVVLPVITDSLSYLHRGRNSLAFRLPNNDLLRAWLKQTGPVATTSANIEGQVPATSIDEAWATFGVTVDFYLEGGVLGKTPSTLTRINSGQIEIIRPGLKKIED